MAFRDNMTSNAPPSLKEGITKFIVDNGIMGTTSGVIIAVATKDFVQSLVMSVVFPVFYLILSHFKFSSFSKITEAQKTIQYHTFFINFVTWITVVILTYFFIQLTLKQILNIKDVKKKEPKEVHAE